MEQQHSTASESLPSVLLFSTLAVPFWLQSPSIVHGKAVSQPLALLLAASFLYMYCCPTLDSLLPLLLSLSDTAALLLTLPLQLLRAFHQQIAPRSQLTKRHNEKRVQLYQWQSVFGLSVLSCGNAPSRDVASMLAIREPLDGAPRLLLAP
jgi:hypothetical protein